MCLELGSSVTYSERILVDRGQIIEKMEDDAACECMRTTGGCLLLPVHIHRCSQSIFASGSHASCRSNLATNEKYTGCVSCWSMRLSISVVQSISGRRAVSGRVKVV